MTETIRRYLADHRLPECSRGVHIANYGSPCARCGDPGPTPIPARKIELGPIVRAQTTKPR